MIALKPVSCMFSFDVPAANGIVLACKDFTDPGDLAGEVVAVPSISSFGPDRQLREIELRCPAGSATGVQITAGTAASSTACVTLGPGDPPLVLGGAGGPPPTMFAIVPVDGETDTTITGVARYT